MQRARQWLTERCIVRKGSCRIVIDLVRLGFVIKLPIIHVAAIFRELRHQYRGSSPISLREWTAFPIDSGGFAGLKQLLFKGIKDNLCEYWFSCANGHPFINATYGSLFGLVNIQKRGDPVPMDRSSFIRQIKRIVGEEMFHRDPHHFGSTRNFCVCGGLLRMVDYGSFRTQAIIRERGVCIQRNFRFEADE